jgi:hypothetical protein
MAASKPMIASDSRRSKRVRTYLHGKLVFGRGAIAIDCIIRNISPSGARLCVQPGTNVPDSVYLIDVARRTAFEANVKWRRRDGGIGLKFSAVHNLECPTTFELKQMRRICADASGVNLLIG